VFPASLSALSVISVLFYPLNEARLSQIASALKERRALEAAGDQVMARPGS